MRNVTKMVLFTLVIGALFCVIGPKAAKAGTGAAHYAAGIALYGKGNYSAALGNFQVSFNKHYFPWYNEYYIGFCHYQLKQYKRAKAWMLRARKNLRRQLPRARGAHIKWISDCITNIDNTLPAVNEAISAQE